MSYIWTIVEEPVDWCVEAVRESIEAYIVGLGLELERW